MPKILRLVIIIGTLTAVVIRAPSSAAADLTFATWNVNGGEQEPETLRVHAAGMEAEIGEIDVLAIQEVISEEQVAAIAEGIGLDHWAISDFSPPVGITGAWFKSLEVAVVSRLPIEAAAEWDLTGREAHGDGHAPRVSSTAIPSRELALDIAFAEQRPSRGFLRVDLDGGWSVFAVHWKSSRGAFCNREDVENARQRENQAAGLVLSAREALADARSVVIAGDLNIQAPGRHLRVGTSPGEDCAPEGTCGGVCGPGAPDGYDDSISALLGMSNDARLLSADLPETYVGEFYPGGAIDHILVAGSRADEFSTAATPGTEGTSYFGSDHRPVIASAPEQ